MSAQNRHYHKIYLNHFIQYKETKMIQKEGLNFIKKLSFLYILLF